MPCTRQGQFDLNTFIPACNVHICRAIMQPRRRSCTSSTLCALMDKADYLILFRNKGATQVIKNRSFLSPGMKKMLHAHNNTPASCTAATSASLGGIDSTPLSDFCFDFVYGFQLSFLFVFLKAY